MASRAVNLWRSVARGAARNRRFATATATETATEQRMRPISPTADFMDHGHSHSTKMIRGDFVPVYVALGLILMSISLGLHTAKHQIAYNPHVRLNKKRREAIPEVEDPDRVLTESDRFVNRSLFRKVAHVQEFDAVRAGISDPTRPSDPFNHPRRAETLKSVGVQPRGDLKW